MGVRFTLWAIDPERLLDVLTDDELHSAADDSLALQCALRRASTSSAARGVVQLILDGPRRWWIGSFLESVKRSPWLLIQSDIEHVECLLSTLLRGLDCGISLRKRSSSECRSSFPIAPKCDVDLRMSVLSSSDFEFLRLFFTECLREENRRFAHPSGMKLMADENDDDWDAAVREIIQSIATTPLDVPTPSLLSFLG